MAQAPCGPARRRSPTHSAGQPAPPGRRNPPGPARARSFRANSRSNKRGTSPSQLLLKGFISLLPPRSPPPARAPLCSRLSCPCPFAPHQGGWPAPRGRGRASSRRRNRTACRQRRRRTGPVEPQPGRRALHDASPGPGSRLPAPRAGPKSSPDRRLSGKATPQSARHQPESRGRGRGGSGVTLPTEFGRGFRAAASMILSASRKKMTFRLSAERRKALDGARGTA